MRLLVWPVASWPVSPQQLPALACARLLELRDRLARAPRDQRLFALRFHQQRITIAQQRRGFLAALLRDQRAAERALRSSELRAVGGKRFRCDIGRPTQRLLGLLDLVFL